jgi:hypothetical protein
MIKAFLVATSAKEETINKRESSKTTKFPARSCDEDTNTKMKKKKETGE